MSENNFPYEPLQSTTLRVSPLRTAKKDINEKRNAGADSFRYNSQQKYDTYTHFIIVIYGLILIQELLFFPFSFCRSFPSFSVWFDEEIVLLQHFFTVFIMQYATINMRRPILIRFGFVLGVLM